MLVVSMNGGCGAMFQQLNVLAPLGVMGATVADHG